MSLVSIAVGWIALLAPACAQKRLVLIEQDGSGPGRFEQMSMPAPVQSPLSRARLA